MALQRHCDRACCRNRVFLQFASHHWTLRQQDLTHGLMRSSMRLQISGSGPGGRECWEVLFQSCLRLECTSIAGALQQVSPQSPAVGTDSIPVYVAEGGGVQSRSCGHALNSESSVYRLIDAHIRCTPHAHPGDKDGMQARLRKDDSLPLASSGPGVAPLSPHTSTREVGGCASSSTYLPVYKRWRALSASVAHLID
jgi:hypothetical protein